MDELILSNSYPVVFWADTISLIKELLFFFMYTYKSEDLHVIFPFYSINKDMER